MMAKACKSFTYEHPTYTLPLNLILTLIPYNVQMLLKISYLSINFLMIITASSYFTQIYFVFRISDWGRSFYQAEVTLGYIHMQV